ncbi:heterokaryon incompatibility protein-domain-containing protein [Rhexocercosporidium sp. MPI-PUGE-AT-0058]|nr:heterokaryon incompatibility protein-domain-containing protein [Rhexocercosporidium sp. MPI-PUGE-AT-0058]
MPWNILKSLKDKSKIKPESEPPAPTYQYSCLDPTTPSIRLAHISPGPPSSPISITLHQVPLFTTPPPTYEALSYTWGPPTPKAHIQLHGLTFPVTPSLSIALYRLRLPDRERIVWIDALCINQTSVPEKTSQVRMMRDIYALSSRVIVWLGPADSTSKTCVDFLKQISLQTFINREAEEEWLVNFMNNSSNDGIWKSLFDFTRRDYWRRMWIVQEIVTGKNISVYCGADELTWDEVLKFMYLVYHNLGALSKHRRPDMVSRFMNVCDGLFPANLNNIKNTEGQHRSLWVNLSFFRYYKCTDERDKIFSILGILSVEGETREGLCRRINYEMDKKEVFIESVRLCGKYVGQGYGPLTVICLSTPWVGDGSLPSWVPDWTYWPDMMALQGIYHSYKQGNTFASGVYDKDVSIQIEGDVLVASGVQIDTLTIVADTAVGADITKQESWESMAPGRHHTFLVLHAYETFYSWAKIAFGPHLEGANDDARVDMFWRTLCCNRAVQSTYLPQFKNQCQKWLARGNTKAIMQFWEEDTRNAGPQEKAWQQSFLQHARGRKFAVMESGGFCLVSGKAKKGDGMAVLVGCDFPVVLRGRKGGGEDDVVLVGEAYVQGYMEGKAMEEAAKGRHMPREFRIH